VFWLVYVTHIYEKRIEFKNDDKYQKLDKLFVSINIIMIAFFLIIEFQNLRKQGLQYFRSFWSMLDISSFGLNIALIVCDLKHIDPDYVRPIAAVTVLMMWCKLFYYLKLFRQTAPLVRMIMQIVSDMKTFSFVFAISVISFGNCFYILSRI